MYASPSIQNSLKDGGRYCFQFVCQFTPGKAPPSSPKGRVLPSSPHGRGVPHLPMGVPPSSPDGGYPISRFGGTHPVPIRGTPSLVVCLSVHLLTGVGVPPSSPDTGTPSHTGGRVHHLPKKGGGTPSKDQVSMGYAPA